jgi:hypothetical protein
MKSLAPRRCGATLLLALAGCGEDVKVGDLFGSATHAGTGDGGSGAGADADDAGDGTSAVDGAPESSGAAESGGIKLDVAAADDGGGGPGCQKVDFLFVVDNSGSMEDEQNNLIESFPLFMDTIQNTLDADDYHIMVVDTDGLFGSQGVQQWPCSPDPSCCESGCTMWPAGTCNGHPCYDWSECDKAVGGGRVSTPQNVSCEIEGDRRYLVDGQPELANTFDCLARVGINGDGYEVQMEAMLAALGPLNGAGQCNEGFVRDDAVLVVVLITDEEDAPSDMGIDYDENSPGDPTSWKDTLVQIKNGDETAVVVLGLIGDPDVPGGVCPPLQAGSPIGGEPSPRLRQFVESFGDHGVWGSVCEQNYDPFFQQAVGLIDTTCDDFEPPG